jgi:hypothetical protein
LEKEDLLACVVMDSREEWGHVSGSGEAPLKSYDVTQFYNKILRSELRVLENTGAASVESTPLSACNIKQLVINQLYRIL